MCNLCLNEISKLSNFHWQARGSASRSRYLEIVEVARSTSWWLGQASSMASSLKLSLLPLASALSCAVHACCTASYISTSVVSSIIVDSSMGLRSSSRSIRFAHFSGPALSNQSRAVLSRFSACATGSMWVIASSMSAVSGINGLMTSASNSGKIPDLRQQF